MDRRNLCKLGLAGIGTMAFSRTAGAMQMFTNASEKKKWAVVYGSKCGSTREYAEFINNGLGGIADVVDIATTTPKIDDYDHFIIGGWRNGSSIQPKEIADFVKNNKAVLKDKIRGLFVVLGNNGKPELSPEMTTFLTNQLVTPSGAITAKTKVLFGRSKAPCGPGNYDNVSEAAGVEFGQSILATAMSISTIHTSMPGQFRLEQVNPSPFNPITPVHYTIPRVAHVELTICALNGRRLATLVTARQEAGNYSVNWDAGRLAPGNYLCQLEAGDFRETRIARVLGY